MYIEDGNVSMTPQLIRGRTPGRQVIATAGLLGVLFMLGGLRRAPGGG